MAKTAKYGNLLLDDTVRRWHENLNAKSMITAEVYLRTLGLFCELNNTDPREIIKNGKSKEFKESFSDFVRKLEREGKAGSYIVRFKKVLKSWLKFNDIQISFNVNIKDEHHNPTIENERVPTKDELSRILGKATKRARVSIGLMALSGLRPESIGNHDGSDGIRLRDFKDAELSGEILKFTESPAILTIRHNLSKARHSYFVFVPDETLGYINAYLKERAEFGERISLDAPLLSFDYYKRGQRGKNQFLRTALVTREIRTAIRGIDLNMRPYVLRAYFATGLDIAESKGLISHPWRMFFMGHKGDIESRYSTNKGRLPPDMIEGMKSAYLKCLPLLATDSREMNAKDMQKEFLNQILKEDGFTDQEIKDLELLEMDPDKRRELRREKLFGSKNPAKDASEMARLDRMAMSKMRNGARQKPIPSYAIEAYLNQGFEFISLIPGDKAIVKLPS